jgi:hypothetical protein
MITITGRIVVEQDGATTTVVEATLPDGGKLGVDSLTFAEHGGKPAAVRNLAERLSCEPEVETGIGGLKQVIDSAWNQPGQGFTAS